MIRLRWSIGPSRGKIKGSNSDDRSDVCDPLSRHFPDRFWRNLVPSNRRLESIIRSFLHVSQQVLAHRPFPSNVRQDYLKKTVFFSTDARFAFVDVYIRITRTPIVLYYPFSERSSSIRPIRFIGTNPAINENTAPALAKKILINPNI